MSKVMFAGLCRLAETNKKIPSSHTQHGSVQEGEFLTLCVEQHCHESEDDHFGALL